MTGDKFSSTGRGGAGNFTKKSSLPPTSVPSETPVLKESVVTSGRGGAGNMMKNDDPSMTRLSQDLQAPVRRESNSAPIGRGGAGNIWKSPNKPKSDDEAVEDSSPRNSGEFIRAKVDKIKGIFHSEKKE